MHKITTQTTKLSGTIQAETTKYPHRYRLDTRADEYTSCKFSVRRAVTKQPGHVRSTWDALSRPCSRLTSALSAWMLCTRCSATSLLLLLPPPPPLPSTIIAWELRGDDGPDTGWSSFCCSILHANTRHSVQT